MHQCDSPPPAPPYGAGIDARVASRLRGQLWRIVCSARWEDDLYSMFLHGELEGAGGRQVKTERVLSRARVYPPGGYESLMKRCTACRRWIPPQALGSSGVCIDCYYCGIPDTQAAELPSARRFTWVVGGAEARAYLAGGMVREKRSKRVQFRDDDPRVVGGPIIGEERIMVDPWLGEIWPSEVPDLPSSIAGAA